MFDSAETDAPPVERKSDKVVTVLMDNAKAECVGMKSIRDVVGQVALKDLEGRRFEERLGASHPCVGQRVVVTARRREGAQRRQTTCLRTSSTQR